MDVRLTVKRKTTAREQKWFREGNPRLIFLMVFRF
jgi:hypothetical protein